MDVEQDFSCAWLCLNIVRVTEELDYSIDKSFQNGLGLLSLLPDVSHCWRRAQPPSWGIRRVVGI
jgi:hypothetical protein